jgi:hypothetical protein
MMTLGDFRQEAGSGKEAFSSPSDPKPCIQIMLEVALRGLARAPSSNHFDAPFPTPSILQRRESSRL